VFFISKCKEESDLGLCMSLVLAKTMSLRSPDFCPDFWFKNMFGRKIRRKSALRSGILFASPELMHRVRSNSSLHFDNENIYQIRTEKWNASARRLLSATLLERWPQVCRVKITFESLASPKTPSGVGKNWMSSGWICQRYKNVSEFDPFLWKVGEFFIFTHFHFPFHLLVDFIYL